MVGQVVDLLEEDEHHGVFLLNQRDLVAPILDHLIDLDGSQLYGWPVGIGQDLEYFAGRIAGLGD